MMEKCQRVDGLGEGKGREKTEEAKAILYGKASILLVSCERQAAEGQTHRATGP